jgi:hypothetical protein
MNGDRAQRKVPAMSDPYAYWRAGCRGTPMPASADDPQPGYYRRVSKIGSDDAVAYWLEDGNLRCMVNGTHYQEPASIEIWTWVCDKTVEEVDYLFRRKHGRWPNENEVLLGHNRPPDDSSVEALVSVLDALRAEAHRILRGGAAKSQDEADQASDIANELMEVAKQAEALHKAEKAPVLAEGKAIDKKWFVVRDAAADLKDELRLCVITPFLGLLRRNAEAALRQAVEEGRPPPPETRVVAGSLKRTTALRTTVSARITDYPAALAHFSDYPEIRDQVQRLADRAARAGVSVPGCVRVEQERAV